MKIELILGARSLCNYLAQHVVLIAYVRVVPHTTGFGSKAEVAVSYVSPAAGSTDPRAVLVQGSSFPNMFLKVASTLCRGWLAAKWV